MAADESLKKRSNSMQNAYTEARKIAPGCQHILGCKCETPFWLREPTARELAFESRIIRQESK